VEAAAEALAAKEVAERGLNAKLATMAERLMADADLDVAAAEVAAEFAAATAPHVCDFPATDSALTFWGCPVCHTAWFKGTGPDGHDVWGKSKHPVAKTTGPNTDPGTVMADGTLPQVGDRIIHLRTGRMGTVRHTAIAPGHAHQGKAPYLTCIGDDGVRWWPAPNRVKRCV
jgi:hypothetical protein